jgi:esterase/lipase
MKKKRKFKFIIWHPHLTTLAKIIISFIIICISSYLMLGIILYFNTDRLVYHPTNDDFYQCEGFKEFTKEEFNGTRFFYRDAIKTDTVLVYYHGNGGSACDRSYLSYGFNRIGVKQIFVEYSGYANDDVKPSKKILENDVININKFIKKENITNIAVIGESLGTALASYHASIEDNVYSAILVAPFDSIRSIAENRYLKFYPIQYFIFDNYDNTIYLQNYTKKLIMVHGGQDQNIPIYHAKKLYNATITEDKVFIEFPFAKHNDLYRYFDTYRAIRVGVNNQSLDQFKLIGNYN